MTAGSVPRRVLLVTGRLAEAPLRRVVASLGPRFECRIATLRITVAALMTTDWIARHLEVPDGTDLVLIPGLVEGDTRIVGEKFGVEVQRGPKDLHALPEFFGRPAPEDYGDWDIEIVAEINNAPKLPRAVIRKTAEELAASGADVIDIGCTPGLAFAGLGDVVAELRSAGLRVSVDTFDPDEIRTAVDRGAELVLSLNSGNLEVGRDLRGSGARVVVLPDREGFPECLEPLLERLTAWEIPCIVDPVLDPIGFGFMASLERYSEVRRRYPDAEMMMGVGNLTELTAADSTGVNAVLVAICQELGIRTVLTTQVIGWAQGAVREIDVARRLMHYAVTRRRIPKGVDDRLVTLRDSGGPTFTPEEILELQAGVTDANYRIFTDPEGIVVFNSERLVRGGDIGEIFGALGVDEATHAFYLGRELERARIALTLGKSYRQEQGLGWGYLTPPDEGAPGRVRLTGRRRRPDADGS